MSINVSSTIENFKNDIVKYYDKYINKCSQFEFKDLEVSLALRISGIAIAVLGAVAAAGAVSAIIAFAPFSAVILGCLGAGMLVFSHDAIKIGDNISKQLNPSFLKAATNYIKAALGNAPAEFQGTIIKYTMYENLLKN